MRKFETGATRDADDSKFDYEGFLSPTVLEAYAAYMHTNRFQADGKMRDSDNWQKGIPLDAYMKSMFRHFMAVWKGHRNGDVKTDELAALMFNVMGYMHEKLKLNSKVITRQMIVESLADASPRARQNAWDKGQHGEGGFTVEDYELMFKPVDEIYTHRYGALAHDQEAIEDEEDKEEGLSKIKAEAFGLIASGFYFLRQDGALIGPYHSKEARDEASKRDEESFRAFVYYPNNEGYEGDVRSVAGMDGGKVVGVSEKRTQEQVEPLAPEIQSAGRCEAPICGCKW